MGFVEEFTVTTDIDTAWATLTDLEKAALCLPSVILNELVLSDSETGEAEFAPREDAADARTSERGEAATTGATAVVPSTWRKVAADPSRDDDALHPEQVGAAIAKCLTPTGARSRSSSSWRIPGVLLRARCGHAA